MTMNNNAKRLLTLPIMIGMIIAGAVPVTTQQAQARKQEDPEKYFRSPNTLHGKTVLIPIGSHIEGRMNQTISSRKSRPGEKFSIEITSPVLANGSDVIIPIGSKIVGEVVEAIPASKQKHRRGTPKPTGKLRTSLTVLETPDGMTRPMIASIAGEFMTTSGGRISPNKELSQPSLGYAGSSASFSAVHPSMNKRNYGNRGPQVVKKRDYWKDPVLGIDSRSSNVRGTPVIRSMIKKGRDIYIMSGSPLTIRVDAPLKISVAPSRGRMSIDMGGAASPMVRKDSQGNFRRFQPAGSTPAPTQEIAGSQPQSQKTFDKKPMLKEPTDPEAHLPRFLRTPKNVRFLKPSPFSVNNQPGQNSQPAAQGMSADPGVSSSAESEPKPVKFNLTNGQPQSGPDDF